jgi:hypothetical protein
MCAPPPGEERVLSRTRKLSLAAFLIAGVAGLVRGQGVVRLGSEFRVNTHTTNYQAAPRISHDGVGNFIVVWQSKNQDGSQTGVYAQRYTSAGATAGAEFKANTYTTSYQAYPAVAQDSAGNFVVAWTTYGQTGTYGYEDVFGQRYTSAGATSGSEFRANTYTTDTAQQFPRVARNGTGFVVVWQSDGQDGDGNGVYGQRYTSAGAASGSEFRANTYTTSEQAYPDVDLDGTGNFVVVWQSLNQDAGTAGVFAQRYNSSGTKVGTEFLVNTTTAGAQDAPAIAVDTAGTFVVIWESPQEGNGFGIVGQRFSNAGAKLGAELSVNTYTTADQTLPAVASDGLGNFVAVWQSAGQDGSNLGIFGQRYTSTGAKRGIEFPVNTYTTGAQSDPAVTMDGSGTFIVTWQSFQDGSTTGIYAQRFSNQDCQNLGGSGPTPSNASACTGGMASLSVVGSGSSVTYQWRRNGTPLTNGGAFSGTTTPTLTVNPVAFANTGSYTCLIKDSCAPQGSLSLGPATITLIDPGAVPGLALTRTGGGASLHLSWGIGANATGYTVFEDSSPGGAFATATGSASSGAVGLTVPMPAGNVFYLVAATNNCGTGPKR